MVISHLRRLRPPYAQMHKACHILATREMYGEELEAGGGIEPPHVGFANRSITTLLPGPIAWVEWIHNEPPLVGQAVARHYTEKFVY